MTDPVGFHEKRIYLKSNQPIQPPPSVPEPEKKEVKEEKKKEKEGGKKKSSKNPKTTTEEQDRELVFQENVKLVIVGSTGIGKTCLLYSYVNDTFPGENIPTVFDNYTTTVTVDGLTVNLGMWDTAGSEDYDRLRPLSYPQTDIVLLCYAINSVDSYDAVKAKFYPEIRHHLPTVKIFLVGLKSDLRGDSAANKAGPIIPLESAELLAIDLGLDTNIDCSGLSQENMDFLFKQAVRTVLTPDKKEKQGTDCLVM
mmetsp:Transcript_27382/g.38097  ORF Transcript_27382/g.38097 Transcript_27382/m.38097 type:complete len:254 (-) Transcript_27382:81-842(-)